MDNLYKIDSIVERPVVEPGGDITKLHRVRATTRSGQSFTVDIPEADFTDAGVREKVQERAELIEGLVG